VRFATLHVGPPLNLWQLACLRSFSAFGHDVVMFCYDSPVLDQRYDTRGLLFADADGIVSRQAFVEFLAASGGNFAHFADLFRYTLLYRRGGWWIDTDVLCLKHEVPDGDVVLGWEGETSICNAIMRFPPGHDLMRETMEFCERNKEAQEWGFLGPTLLTRLVNEHGLRERVRRDLYPVRETEAYDLIDPAKSADVTRATQDSSFLHIWHTYFKIAGFQCNFLPPAGSALYDAVRRHVANAGGVLDHAAYLRHLTFVRETMRLTKELRRLQDGGAVT